LRVIDAVRGVSSGDRIVSGCEESRPEYCRYRDGGAGAHVSEVFRYATDIKLAPFWLPFGVRPSKDGVTLTNDGRFVATFGFLRVETPLDNVDEAHVTSDYRWWTAAGARLSLVDDGLTFGTNAARGVCVHFRTKVPSRLRRSGHSALTVTVADPAGLAAVLAATDRGSS
jgi:hypothetical protein